MNKSSVVFSVLVACSSPISTYGQEVDLGDLQGNIDIFTGVMEDALGLDQNSGLFGMRLGGVDSTYLYGQGVVFEVRTPLANERNRLSLTSLNSAMQSLQSGGNPFERLSLQSSPLTARQQETDGPALNGLYQSMMERITKIDYSIAVSNAIEQASDSARSLRVLGNVDDSGYEELRVELEAMRETMQDNLEKIGQLEEEIREAGTATAAIDSNESDVSSRFDLLLETIEPLRQQAILKAAELKAETELAEQRYVERWHDEVSEFEQNLYVVMCNYGSTLRALPEDEKLSVILKGLGEDTATTTRRPDKVHVLHKRDIQQCLQEEIDVAELIARSEQYSY
jgi:hypothetical protein